MVDYKTLYEHVAIVLGLDQYARHLDVVSEIIRLRSGSAAYEREQIATEQTLEDDDR